jgi:hypothetical protein
LLLLALDTKGKHSLQPLLKITEKFNQRIMSKRALILE